MGKKRNGRRKYNIRDVKGNGRSKNIIQCTQESFKVPAVVYKYVACQAVEAGGGGGGGCSYQQQAETGKPDQEAKTWSCSSLC